MGWFLTAPPLRLPLLCTALLTCSALSVYVLSLLTAALPQPTRAAVCVSLLSFQQLSLVAAALAAQQQHLLSHALAYSQAALLTLCRSHLSLKHWHALYLCHWRMRQDGWMYGMDTGTGWVLHYSGFHCHSPSPQHVTFIQTCHMNCSSPTL